MFNYISSIAYTFIKQSSRRTNECVNRSGRRKIIDEYFCVVSVYSSLLVFGINLTGISISSRSCEVRMRHNNDRQIYLSFNKENILQYIRNCACF